MTIISFPNLNAYFEGREVSHYWTGIEMLEDCYYKCTSLDGGYVEEQAISSFKTVCLLLAQILFVLDDGFYE